jgi:hypothetical protein
MDNFDLRKYLIENKVTRGAKLLNEGHYWETGNENLVSGKIYNIDGKERTVWDMRDLKNNPENREKVKVDDVLYQTFTGDRSIVYKVDDEKIYAFATNDPGNTRSGTTRSGKFTVDKINFDINWERY